MMIHEIASIVINQPVDVVYAFLSIPENRLKYDPDLIEIRQKPLGPIELGTQIVEVRGLMGRRGEMVTEVFELEPKRRIGYRTLQGDSMNASGYYQFDSIPEGTRLTLNFTLDPRGLMKLATPFIAQGLKRSIPAGLQNIKTVIEGQSEVDHQ